MQPRRRESAGAWMAAALLGAAACGGTQSFGLSSDDNDPPRLRAALALVDAPAAGQPINERGAPMVYIVGGATKGGAPSLIAYDLAAEREVWRVEADVKSRVLTGRSFVAYVGADGQMTARAVSDGRALWSAPVAGEFLGGAADATRVYYVHETRAEGKPTWTLVALDGATGARLWDTPSPGQLGAPAARGGLVFSPFLKQWLVVLDARTGRQLARIRGIDEEIAFVRAESAAVYFGSKDGVFLLDDRAASGKRSSSTYGQAVLPGEFVRSFFYWDAFDPVQARYSAYDQNRLLWRGAADGDAFAWTGGVLVVHTYKFFFGFDPSSGELRWAYANPRADAIASEHVGDVVGFVSLDGRVGALDPKTGGRKYDAKVKLEGTVRGATFDADGWRPAGAGTGADTADALAAIARDRDQRFLDVKLFALSALAEIHGPDATADLLALVRDSQTPPKVRDKAVQVLIARRDRAGLHVLVEALGARYDYIAGTEPAAVAEIARAIAAMGDLTAAQDGPHAGAAVEPGLRRAVFDALIAQLFDPRTPWPALAELATALGATGLPGANGPLSRLLLTYRADPAFAAQMGAVGATIEALLRRGGIAERELVAFVSEDPNTQSAVAEYAARALRQTEPPIPARGEAAAEAD